MERSAEKSRKDIAGIDFAQQERRNMPYFDDRTYDIGNWIRYEGYLRDYAEDFLETCRISRYPEEILRAAERAVSHRNRNEMIIMADATTEFAEHSEKAFAEELEQAKSREARYDLICITMAAMLTYRVLYYRNAYYRRLDAILSKAKEEYDTEFGKEDLHFLEAFTKKRIKDILPKMQEDDAAIKRRHEEYEENERQRKLQEEQQAIARAKEIAEREAAQKERQKRRNEARRKELEQFRSLPLAEQLQTIVSNPVRPKAYEVDYSQVSMEDLRALPKSLLADIMISFVNETGAGWRELKKKAKAALIE